MLTIKSFANSYLDFHYGFGLAIAIVLFGIIIFVTAKRHKSQGESISRKEVLYCLALSVYVVLILGGTLLNRTIGQCNEVKLQLFWSYFEAYEKQDKALALQMLYNVLAFIPWGVVLARIWKGERKFFVTVASAAIFSLFIELLQLILQCGWFEFDDVFHNTLGAVIGYAIWRIRNKKKV